MTNNFILKAQIDIIKEMYKYTNEPTKHAHIMVSKISDTNLTAICPSPYYFYALPNNRLFINIWSMYASPFMSIAYNDYVKIGHKMTYDGILRAKNKCTAVEIYNGDYVLNIDLKYVNKFGKPEDLTFVSIDSHSPVGIFSYDGIFMGAIAILKSEVTK